MNGGTSPAADVEQDYDNYSFELRPLFLYLIHKLPMLTRKQVQIFIIIIYTELTTTYSVKYRISHGELMLVNGNISKYISNLVMILK